MRVLHPEQGSLAPNGGPGPLMGVLGPERGSQALSKVHGPFLDSIALAHIENILLLEVVEDFRGCP